MKRLLFVTNLFPRPDLPRCGMFNAHFARALAECLSRYTSSADDEHAPFLDVLVPVPEWRFWRHAPIRVWQTPSELTALLPSGVRVHYVPVFYIPVVGRSLSRLFYRLAFRGQRERFETCSAVLGSWLYPDCVAAADMASAVKRPFWARLHGTDRFHLDAPLRGSACRKALDTALGIFVNAESMKRELVNRGVAGDRVRVVCNGVDREWFQPRVDLPQRFQAVGGAHPVLWVGNLVEIKGPDVALRAFAGMKRAPRGTAIEKGKQDESPTEKCGTRASRLHVAQSPCISGGGTPSSRIGENLFSRSPDVPIPSCVSDTQLLLIGDGPMRAQLEGQAKALGISDAVVFLGSQSQRDVALWMNRASCLLLSSRSEGMPNVVIEALASGVPVVSTQVG
ncbi:MAG: glycosyltransferase, partial [Verrucomicrobia bacterium]|nr:glycosyltransferase [Verrucomicrobiota bacterium]